MRDAANTSTLWLAILGLIRQEPRSGYDLQKVFSTTPMGHFSASPGAIYPALKRFEDGGLVEGRVDDERELRPRKLYSLTPKGEEALRRRISRPVTRDDVIWHLDDVMLRFAFGGAMLGRDWALAFLEELAGQIESYVSYLDEQLGALDEEGGPYGRYALEHGAAMYRAAGRWARRVIEELKKED